MPHNFHTENPQNEINIYIVYLYNLEYSYATHVNIHTNNIKVQFKEFMYIFDKTSCVFMTRVRLFSEYSK